MTSPVNYVDPTGHMAVHDSVGSSSVGLVPAPEPDTTTGLSTGSGGGGAETNICASAGVNIYWLINLVYINGD